MKFSIISLILAAVLSPCAMATYLVVQIKTNNDASHPLTACERETNINIGDAIHDAIIETVDGVSWNDDDNNESGRRLNSYFGGVSSFCRYHCYGYAKGYCYLSPAGSRCAGVRRELEAEEGSSQAEHTRMLTPDDLIVEEERGVKCAQAALVSEAALHALALVAETDVCRAALMAEDKHYTCFNVIGLKL